MSRHSLNIDAKRVPNKAALFDALTKLNPAACVVMDGLGLAKEIKAAFPACIVSHRAFGESDAHKAMSAKALAERHARENYGDIYTYGINEPVAGGDWSWKRIADWLAESMIEQKRLGLHGVIGNWPPGAIEPSDLASGAFDNYLRVEAEHANWHVRGIHDYTGFLLPFGGDWGGRVPEDVLNKDKVQRANWTTKAEFADIGVSYHLGRDRRFDQRAASIGIHTTIRRIATEFGLDRMPNWELRPGGNIYRIAETRYGTSGYSIIRGLNSYAAYYAAMFPGASFDEVIYWQMQWADSVYPPEYLAFCWYSWTPGTSDWDIAYGFDMSKRSGVFTRVAQSGGGTVANVPKPTTAPIRARLKTLPSGATYRNIRGTLNDSGQTGADVGDLIIGDEVFYVPATAATFNYHYVRQMKTGVEGWVLAAPSVTFEPIPDTPDSAELAALREQVAILTAEKVGLQATNATLSTMNTSLQAEKAALMAHRDDLILRISASIGLARDIHEAAGHLANTMDGGLESVDKVEAT